jgi:hypothetical protein
MKTYNIELAVFHKEFSQDYIKGWYVCEGDLTENSKEDLRDRFNNTYTSQKQLESLAQWYGCKGYLDRLVEEF